MKSRLVRAAKSALHRARRPLRRRSTAHGLILMYHRIAAEISDPWDLCVAPEHFREQLDVLSSLADVVPLPELRSRLKIGRRHRPTVALSFDDGYADNLYRALPSLQNADIPATVFISTSWIGSVRFWWDVLAATVFQAERLQPRVHMKIGGQPFEWVASASDGTIPPAERRDLHLALWRRLQTTDESSRNEALGELAVLLGAPASIDPESRPMTADELCQLAESPLIDIGSHTMTHCPLPKCPADQQFREIAGSRNRCADITGRVPTSFAYPYGEYDHATPPIVACAGFTRACSTDQDLVWETGDPLLMPRCTVLDWDGDAFERRLRWAWLP